MVERRGAKVQRTPTFIVHYSNVLYTYIYIHSVKLGGNGLNTHFPDQTYNANYLLFVLFFKFLTDISGFVSINFCKICKL